jgi:hypothetical protein
VTAQISQPVEPSHVISQPHSATQRSHLPPRCHPPPRAASASGRSEGISRRPGAARKCHCGAASAHFGCLTMATGGASGTQRSPSRSLEHASTTSGGRLTVLGVTSGTRDRNTGTTGFRSQPCRRPYGGSGYSMAVVKVPSFTRHSLSLFGRLMARNPASHLEIWCLHLGIWLVGTSLLLALGDRDFVTFGPLIFVMIINACVLSLRLHRRQGVS